MKKNTKKFTSLLLSAAMVLSTAQLAPLAVSAAEKALQTSVDVAGTSYHYDVVLPEGYNGADESRHYPVLYVLPDDGLSTNAPALTSELETALSSDSILDTIVVYPDFVAEAEAVTPYDAMAAIIASVDEEYNTIASPSARAVLGAQTGGYLASIFTYTDGQGNFTSSPRLFGMSASINGDYVSEENIWLEDLGNFYDIITNNGSGNGKFSNAIARSFYTYMDSASESDTAAVNKGSNDIISYMINRGGAYGGFYYSYYGNAGTDVLMLTIKNSAYTDAFLRESVDEAIQGIGDKLVQNMISGKLVLTPQAAKAALEKIEATYAIQVNSLYTAYCGDQENPLTLTISMTDPANGQKVSEDVSISFPVKENPDAYTNEAAPIALPNTIPELSTNVSLTASILGKSISLDSKSLVRIAETGTAPEDQLIDLLGNWKFMATKSVTPGVVPQASEYASWEEVYPCLGWWDESHSKETNMKAYAGYAWYIKEFDIPASFPEGDYVVPVGFFDETDIVFINDVMIGCTGMNQETWTHQTDCWDTERIYHISSDILNIGGKNVMTVLTHNQSGDGGWYSGHPGLYSAAAYNKLTAKPSIFASEADAAIVKAAIQTQENALATKNPEAYAACVDPEFFQSGITKSMLLEEIAGYLEGDGTPSFRDTNQLVYESNGLFYYTASRSILTASGESLKQDVREYYTIQDGKALLYGEHDRFFTQYIESAYKAEITGGDSTESFLVYLPEGYFDPENAGRFYPTAYLFHQINSSSNSYAIDGIDKLADLGISEGRIKDCILVIPDSSPSSWWMNGWDKMVTEEVLPFVDSHYRTIQDARYRFTAGASMGGSGSYYIGLTNPQLFSGIVSFFGALNMGASPVNIAVAASDEYLKYYTHFFVCGNRDLYKFGIPAITLDKRLRQADIEHFFEIEEGEHDSIFYLPYVIDAFAYQTDKMQLLSDAEAASVISGQVNAFALEAGSLEASVTLVAGENIAAYKNTIPESQYTDSTNPAITIPVTAIVSKDGKTLFTQTQYVTLDEAGSFDLTFSAENADLVRSASLTVLANLSGGCVTLAEDLRMPIDFKASIEEDTFLATGKKIEPAVTVTSEGLVLKANRDYKVSYSNNVAAGTATVTITGKHEFKGCEATLTFTIKPGKDKNKKK